MRLGTWLFVGASAREFHARAMQCRTEQAKSARRLEELRRVQDAHEATKAKFREAVADKEQLKGILSIVDPARLAAWKQARKSGEL